MTEFPSKYKFNESEQKWQNFWQSKNIYRWDANESREKTYVVDTPPPGVSGHLHIGHVYSYTHTDFIVRYKRMKGMNVFYPMGFDDNGLPTEKLVEKERNIRAVNMNRQDFIKACNEVVAVEEAKFKALFNKIALSVDWSLEYQTISPESCRISQMSFLDLVEKGEIYRDSQPMLWDPIDQTALAQAEIEDKEKTTFMNDIKFSLEDGSSITIATTRPELLPACVAVFFHPDDKRYGHLASKYALSPLFNVKVPLLADDMVDPEKGTGLVMCCTFGDQTDILWWRKHKLPTKIIISKQGRMENMVFDHNCLDVDKAENFASQLNGLKINEARERILLLLDEEGLLISQTERLQTVKCAERSGAPLEILTTAQWFIKTIAHKEALLKKSAELNWHPQSMKIKLDKWIEGIGLDWCISRQRFFGVPFPVWYSKRAGEEGKIIYAKIHQLPVDPLVDLPEGYTRDEVIADSDVMDTWSTSAVSPQLNSQGISGQYMVDRERHQKLFPADLRPQAHEIIRTWAFYTLLKAYLHENTLPWKNIMISGWCLAQDRSKMSKSKGNVIVPEVLLENFGADVIRYWSANSKPGVDTAYSEDVINNGKRLVNKLWNAAKFVSTHFDKIPENLKGRPLNEINHLITHEFDQYMVNKLAELLENVDREFSNYEYANALHKTESFFWSLFCDNYLEIAKTRAYNESGENNAGALSAYLTLYLSLEVLLKLFAPILPHITEELYQLLFAKADNSIHSRGYWPDLSGNEFTELNSENSLALLEIVEMVRKIKAQLSISVKAPLSMIEIKGATISDELVIDLKDVTSAKLVKFVEDFSTEGTIFEGEKISINASLLNN